MAVHNDKAQFVHTYVPGASGICVATVHSVPCGYPEADEIHDVPQALPTRRVSPDAHLGAVED